MGFDAIKPFLDEDISAFVLCKTSNPSSNQIQSLEVENKLTIYQEVAKMVSTWNAGKNLGLVVGATDIEALKKVREVAPNLWILSPGIGAQGGDLEESVKYGMRDDGMGIVFNVSRGISRASDMTAKINEYKEQIKNIKITDKPSSKLLPYQREFIEFAIKHEVLRFGSFKLKSGRMSPFFFNAGRFSTGEAMNKLGYYYFSALQQNPIDFDIIFGPAYKGITLACALSMTIDKHLGKTTPYAYDRKEAKEGGEGGNIVGADVNGKKILIIDDVITAGTAIGEACKLLQNSKPVGVIICLDRQEKGKDSDESAIQEVEKKYGIPVISVIKLEHIVEYLREKGDKEEELKALMEYRQKYGAKEI